MVAQVMMISLILWAKQLNCLIIKDIELVLIQNVKKAKKAKNNTIIHTLKKNLYFKIDCNFI